MPAATRVGGHGKPVRIRHGPATVTGEALRSPHDGEPLGSDGAPWEGAER
jgi:hypothetical protein